MPLIGFNDGDLDARHGQGACRKRGRVVMGVPGRRAVGLAGDLLPDRHLALAVGRDGEGLQHFEVDLVGAVGVQQLRRRVAEAEALLDDALGGPEAHRDARAAATGTADGAVPAQRGRNALSLVATPRSATVHTQ